MCRWRTDIREATLEYLAYQDQSLLELQSGLRGTAEKESQRTEFV